MFDDHPPADGATKYYFPVPGMCVDETCRVCVCGGVCQVVVNEKNEILLYKLECVSPVVRFLNERMPAAPAGLDHIRRLG